MSQKWLPTKYAGVRYREHKSRKIDPNATKDKYFCIYYRLGNKLKWEAVGWQSQGATLEKANLELADRKNNIRNGNEIITLRQKKLSLLKVIEKYEEEKTTLSYYWETEYLPKISRKYKKSSLKRTESIFNKWLIPLFSNKKIADIDKNDWKKALETLLAAKIAPRTRIYIIGEMKRIINDAKENGLTVKYYPQPKDIELPAPNNRRERIISTQEAGLILKNLNKNDLNAYKITKFAFLSGCRFSECAKLKRENIRNEFIVCNETKNGTNKKIIISKSIRELLNDTKHLKLNDFLFPDKNGAQYKQPPKIFAKTVNALHLNDNRERLDKITFHSIRHSVATKLAYTLDMRTLMEFMGWKRMEMALRYIHNNHEAAKKAAEKLKEFSD